MFEMKFKTDNESFKVSESMEVIGIMAGVMSEIGNGRKYGMIRDTNGNTIGAWSLKESEE